MEKEIRSPSAVTQTERVTMSLQVEDVEKAHKDALAAVTEAKGRVTKSDLKQHAAGQYTATLHFEVAPEAALPLRDRLKQLGTVATLGRRPRPGDRGRHRQGRRDPQGEAEGHPVLRLDLQPRQHRARAKWS
jgi:hypothetical protein